jgi:hypothetical protein
MHFTTATILAFVASAVVLVPRQATNNAPPLCPASDATPNCCQLGGQKPYGCEDRKFPQQNGARETELVWPSTRLC